LKSQEKGDSQLPNENCVRMDLFTLASISFICGIDIILSGKVFYENLENAL